jgi:hypothetical protein
MGLIGWSAFVTIRIADIVLFNFLILEACFTQEVFRFTDYEGTQCQSYTFVVNCIYEADPDIGGLIRLSFGGSERVFSGPANNAALLSKHIQTVMLCNVHVCAPTKVRTIDDLNGVVVSNADC